MQAARIMGAIILAVGLWGITATTAQESASGPGGVAVLTVIDGPIGPATVHHVEDTLSQARARGAVLAILQLNTPGGLASSMREIISEILASPIPVAGYVAPPGAHAASAGTYIMYATHVAAMAPGTNLGAATPVQIGGMPGGPPTDREPPGDGAEEKTDDDADKSRDTPPAERRSPTAPGTAMEAKAVNDAVAFIRSLADMHGRNADWAEKAVREAASLSAEDALKENVIDLMANDVPGLLAAIDGRTVTVLGQERTLATGGLHVETIEPGTLTRLLAVLSNPNVAFILMMIGVYGLIFEFANPGSIGPGVIGAICLVLGLYALNQLPLDTAGLALVGLGLALMVAEAFTPTFGVLGIGGLVAFIIGAIMLIDTDVPAYQLSWPVIAGTAVVSGGLLAFVLGYVMRAHRRPVHSGAEDMIGSPAEVIDWAGGTGHVQAHGERWQARGSGSFMPGDSVRIKGLNGLTLEVGRPEHGSSAEETPGERSTSKGD